MKIILTFLLILFSGKTFAKTPETDLIKIVLSDSIIAEYMSEYGGIKTNVFTLSGSSGYYSYENGKVNFEEQNCQEEPSCIGMISKLKIKKSKAVVKIHFTENKKYNTKVKFDRVDNNFPWRIKSRMIYNNFHLPKNQSRLIYYSLNT